MIVFNIPGRDQIKITDVLLDYNGTIAKDGHLIKGVAESINRLSGQVRFHVITADTFGSVQKALEKVDCRVHVICGGRQDEQKRDFLSTLGETCTLCVGNGENDRLMLEKAVVGIAVLQEEGLAFSALSACDLVVKDILDVFAYFDSPGRLAASLRN